MKTVLLFVLFTTFVAGQLDISYTRNVTGSISNNGWQYRSTNIANWNLGELDAAVYYSSLAAGASTGSVEVESLWGAASVSIDNFPISFLAYWDIGISFDSSITNWFGIDVSGAAGFVAQSYVALVEKDSNGNVVLTSSLAEQEPIFGSLSYELTNSGTDSTSGLKWSTITGTSTAGWTIDITYILSNVAGVISYGNAYVGPKSLESVVNIQNYPYKSSTNTLSLVMGVGTGAVTVSGKTLFSNPNTDNQVFFTASGQATVDSSTQDVTVTYSATSDFNSYFDNDDIETLLSAATKGSYSLQIVTTAFPAGAKNILYDPSVGAGQPVQDAHSSASFVGPNNNLFALIVVLFCVVVAL